MKRKRTKVTRYRNPATGDRRTRNGTTFIVTRREKSRVYYRTIRGAYRVTGWVAGLTEWRAYFRQSITRLPGKRKVER